MINKKTQITEFSVVIPEQSKFIKPVYRAILCMIAEGDANLTIYLNKLLRKKNPEQRKKHFLVSDTWKTWQNWGSHTITDTTPQRSTGVEKGKLNSQEDTWYNFFERFDNPNTLLIEVEKQAIEYLLVDYHDILSQHRMEIRMNT